MPEFNIADIFSNRAFHMVPLTEAINRVGIQYGMINALNIFPLKPTTSRIVGIEEKSGTLTLIPTQPRGGEANKHNTGKRKMRYLEVPHYPLEDRIMAADMDGLRAFGTNQLEEAMRVINERQAEMVDNFAITLEFARMGALKGKVLDADGSTILDLFTEFGISEVVVDFDLSNPDSDIPKKCRDLKRHMIKNLEGDVMNNVLCLCGPDFFDDLVAHAAVKDAYRYQQGDANNPMREDLREKGFNFHGVTFKEYLGEAAAPGGAVHTFVPVDEARAVPMGTRKTFGTFAAPADFFETVNQRGKLLYSKIAPDRKYNRYVDLHSQSNVIPFCHRPALLVRLTG